MRLSKRELAQVVWQATGLYGRRDAASLSRSSVGDEELVQSRLMEWRRQVAADDQDAFVRRLALDGLDLETARRLLDSEALAAIPAIPEWARILDDALERMAAPPAPLPNKAYPPLVHPQAHLPFEELLVPFVEVARRRLSRRAEEGYGLLEQSAHNYLERSLLFTLSHVFTPTAELEFSLFRLPHQSSFSRLVSKQQNQPSTRLYDDFIAHMRDG